MNRLLLLAAGATLLAACSDLPTESPVAPGVPEIIPALGASAQVTTSANDGAGSLRAAIEAANVDPSITLILVERNLGTVTLQQPLHYEGSQDLAVLGGGLILDGSGLGSSAPVFLADGGGDLKVTGLTIENAPTYGLQVEVPSTADGVQSLTLDGVTVRGSGLHGVLMNDQETPLFSPFPEDGDVTDPADAQDGSNASVRVRIAGSTFEDNGFDALDNDGVRINEGGNGDLDFSITGSRTTGNGADGIELDERGPGNAVFEVLLTEIHENGFFDLNTPPADRDLDDGIDVDEWGTGDIIGRFQQVNANDNAEQGLDLNENEAGDLRVTMANVEASRNGQEGIELEEDDDVAGGGSIDADLAGITTNGNGLLEDDEGRLGDGGLKSREKGDGDNHTQVVGAVSNNNQSEDGDGVLVREEGNGDIETRLTTIFAANNGANGMQVREAGGGALDARIVGGAVSRNGNVGVRLRDNGEAFIISLSNPNGLQVAGGVTLQQAPAP
jgi:hypothetical protein